MPASEPSNTRNCNTGITTTSALVADVDHTTRLTNGVRYSRRRFLSASAPLPVWLNPKLGIRGKLLRRIKRAEALQASPIRLRSLPISSRCSRRLDAAEGGRAFVNELRDVHRQILSR